MDLRKFKTFENLGQKLFLLRLCQGGVTRRGGGLKFCEFEMK